MASNRTFCMSKTRPKYTRNREHRQGFYYRIYSSIKLTSRTVLIPNNRSK